MASVQLHSQEEAETGGSSSKAFVLEKTRIGERWHHVAAVVPALRSHSMERAPRRSRAAQAKESDAARQTKAVGIGELPSTDSEVSDERTHSFLRIEGETVWVPIRRDGKILEKTVEEDIERRQRSAPWKLLDHGIQRKKSHILPSCFRSCLPGTFERLDWIAGYLSPALRLLSLRFFHGFQFLLVALPQLLRCLGDHGLDLPPPECQQVSLALGADVRLG